jgi:hemerythrin
MPIIEWTEKYKLKNEHFDTNHQLLVDLLNLAHDNFVEDSCYDGFTATINHFFHHVLQHFGVEEPYMANTEYEGYDEHITMHRRFSEQVVIMKHDLRRRLENLPLEMLYFLENWLSYEILVADAEYVRLHTGNQWKRYA